MFRKMVLAMLCFFMVFSSLGVFAGGSQETEGQNKEKIVKISIAYENHPGSPLDTACQRWKELIEEKSKGTLEVTVYPSSQIGSITDIMDQAMAGDAVLALGQSAMYADRGVAEFDAPFAPFLFRSWEEVDKLMASDWWKEKENQMEDKMGLKIVSNGWRYAVRYILSKTPINSVDDLKGMKIRVNPTTAQIKGFEVLDAAPVPMGLGEVYTALQQGTIDAFEGSPQMFYNGKYGEVAKYLTLTGHVYLPASWTINADFFYSLTKQQQDALIESGKEIVSYFNQLSEEDSERAMESLKEEGVIIAEPNYEEFAKKAEAFWNYPEFSHWSPDLKEKFESIIK